MSGLLRAYAPTAGARWAKTDEKWVQLGVGQGVRGVHAPQASTEGRPEVGALGGDVGIGSQAAPR